MQRRQGVCVLTALRIMLAGITLCVLLLGMATNISAQGVNTSTLSGTVVDPQGLGVKGAKITLTNANTGATRGTVADDAGHYNFVGLPPGKYTMSVDGGGGFAVYQN